LRSLAFFIQTQRGRFLRPPLGKVYSELLLLFVVVGVVVFFVAVTSPVSFWLAATAGI